MTHEFSTRLQAAVQKSLGTDAIEDNGLDFVFIFYSLNLSDFLSPEKLTQELPRAKCLFFNFKKYLQLLSFWL